jgi:hypothetical protein
MSIFDGKTRKEDMAKVNLERNEAIKDIEMANKGLEEWRLTLLESYAKPVCTNPKNAAWLAQKLSEKYPTLRVTIAYENGYPSVSASPAPKVFETTHYPENQSAAALATLAKVSTQWPSYEVVAAYADGYNCGCAFMKENEELKAKIATMRDERRDMIPFHPAMMMRGF